jgi:hypothetical protein
VAKKFQAASRRLLSDCLKPAQQERKFQASAEQKKVPLKKELLKKEEPLKEELLKKELEDRQKDQQLKRQEDQQEDLPLRKPEDRQKDLHQKKKQEPKKEAGKEEADQPLYISSHLINITDTLFDGDLQQKKSHKVLVGFS